MQQGVLHAGRELRILSQDAALVGNLCADGFRQRSFGKLIEELRELLGSQAGDGGEEGARRNTCFSLSFGLIVSEREGVPEFGVKTAPEAMQKVVAVCGCVGCGRGTCGFAGALLSDLHLLPRQVDLPGTDHDRDEDAQDRNLKLDGHWIPQKEATAT